MYVILLDNHRTLPLLHMLYWTFLTVYLRSYFKHNDFNDIRILLLLGKARRYRGTEDLICDRTLDIFDRGYEYIGDSVSN